MISVSLASIIKLIRMGALIGIGALTSISKNTFEGKRLFGKECFLEEAR